MRGCASPASVSQARDVLPGHSAWTLLPPGTAGWWSPCRSLRPKTCLQGASRTEGGGCVSLWLPGDPLPSLQGALACFGAVACSHPLGPLLPWPPAAQREMCGQHYGGSPTSLTSGAQPAPPLASLSSSVSCLQRADGVRGDRSGVDTGRAVIPSGPGAPARPAGEWTVAAAPTFPVRPADWLTRAASPSPAQRPGACQAPRTPHPQEAQGSRRDARPRERVPAGGERPRVRWFAGQSSRGRCSLCVPTAAWFP